MRDIQVAILACVKLLSLYQLAYNGKVGHLSGVWQPRTVLFLSAHWYWILAN